MLTLFCPNEERLVNDGPVLNNEDSGPKLVDLFTPEFCLKVGDTFVKTIKVEEEASTPAVTQWLQKQREKTLENPKEDKKPEELTNLVTQLVVEKTEN